MHALVLSGGGSKGAWQAGALQRLAEAGLRPDLCCGVSVGALGAAFLAMYAPGDEVAATRDLVALWKSLDTRRVRRHHFPFGFLHGLWRPSLYDSGPLHRLVHRTLEVERLRRSGRRLLVGTVSLADGRYRLFGEQDERIVDAVLASSAFPAMLEPIAIDGALHIDGGLREITPLAAAIDAGATEIDILLVHPPAFEQGPLFEGGHPNAVQLAARSLEILLNEVMANDLQTALRTNDSVRRGTAPDGHRYVEIRVLRPTAPLEGSALAFEPSRIEAMIERGRRDADAHLADALRSGPPTP